jgi:hypothetical protein
MAGLRMKVVFVAIKYLRYLIEYTGLVHNRQVWQWSISCRGYHGMATGIEARTYHIGMDRCRQPFTRAG